MRLELGLICLLGAVAFGAASSNARADEVAPVQAAPVPQSAPPAPSVSAQELAQVRAELARQARQIQELQARERERASQPPALRFSGYVQVDFTPYNQSSQNEINFSTGMPLNQDRFSLRRGHLRVDAEHGFLSGALEIDANTTNGAQLRPIDAEVALRWPEREDPHLPSVSLSAGLMKIPFGFEVPELDAVRPFLERSNMARAFFPGEFDLGACVRAEYQFLELALALMNGHPIGDRVFPALAPDAKKELVGRLGTTAEVAPGVLLALGVSADAGNGFHEGTPTTKDELVWRDDNGDGIVQATEVQVIPGSSATASQQFHRFALGADARLRLLFAPHAELALRGEIVRASNLDRGVEPADPIGAGRDLREFGWYLGVTQEITAWALLGVRYDYYDPDQDAREQQAAQVVPRDRSYSTLALLAMLRYDTARLSFEYDRNHNALGRDASGAPTNLKSDAFTMRAQVLF